MALSDRVAQITSHGHPKAELYRLAYNKETAAEAQRQKKL